jgi:hypothetical protein
MCALSLLPLLLATACFAAPSRRAQNCIPNQSVYLPQFQNVITAPSDPLQWVTVGVGNQNYTCSDSGTYTSTGAVVQVFDISSLFPGPEYYSVQDSLFFGWVGYEGDDPSDPNLIQQITDDFGIQLLGQHYFINSGDSIAPVWDLRETQGQDAVVVATVVGDIPSPGGPPSVDWLELNAATGCLASTILRLYTVGGDPPPICSPNSDDISVKFTTQYMLYGGSVGTCSN